MKNLIQELRQISQIQELEKKSKLYLVGGLVRDHFLNLPSKDIDILVTGLPIDEISDIISSFGKVDLVGKRFGILKWNTYSHLGVIDIAIPRSDIKTTEGHRGFIIHTDPFMSLEKDLFRRDFTINSMAYSFDEELIDPFEGLKDLKNKIIKATNSEAFIDDPLRMLRAIRFASRFKEFNIDLDTFILITSHSYLINEISGERIFEEFISICNKSDTKKAHSLLIASTILNVLRDDNEVIFIKPTEELGDFIYTMFKDLKNKSLEDFLRNKLKATNYVIEWCKALHIISKDLSILEICNILYKLPQIYKSIFLSENNRKIIQELKELELPIHVTQLNINGEDLMSLGYVGKDIALIATKCLEYSLHKKKIFSKVQLIDYIKSELC